MSIREDDDRASTERAIGQLQGALSGVNTRLDESFRDRSEKDKGLHDKLDRIVQETSQVLAEARTIKHDRAQFDQVMTGTTDLLKAQTERMGLMDQRMTTLEKSERVLTSLGDRVAQMEANNNTLIDLTSRVVLIEDRDSSWRRRLAPLIAIGSLFGGAVLWFITTAAPAFFSYVFGLFHK